MKKKSLVFSLIFFLLQNILFAQIGGQTIFQFLNFPASARIDAMGGTVNNIHDDDLNFGFQNPALYSEEMNNRVSLSPVFYLADSKYGFVGYSHSFRKNSLKKIGSFGAGIQYLNYGKFTGTDNWGYITDTFSANDLAFIVGGSRQYNEKLSYGVNLKFITSRYNIYTANALAADIGGAYYDFRKEICIGFSLKNFGYEFNQFSSHNHEKLPFNIQAGISKKLKHTPFLFSLNLQHLEKFNIRYDNPDDVQEVILGDTTTPAVNHHTADKILRHCIFATEISIGKNLKINVGLNDLRRQELAITTRKGLAGFSVGFTLKLNRFDISYSRSSYSVVDGINHFTLGINLGEYFAKGKKK